MVLYSSYIASTGEILAGLFLKRIIFQSIGERIFAKNDYTNRLVRNLVYVILEKERIYDPDEID